MDRRRNWFLIVGGFKSKWYMLELVTPGHIWSLLVKLVTPGHIWSHMVTPGENWSHLDTPGYTPTQVEWQNILN